MPADGAISSRQNPRFKAALALRESSERRARGQLLVDGAREIGRALDAGVTPVQAWLAPDRLRTDAARGLVPRLGAAGAELIEIAPELLARLAYGQRDEGIVALLEAPPTGLDRLRPPDPAFIAVAEGVEKPGNLGAILRSADGAGVDAVIVVDPVSDVWNPNTVRASLGTAFTLPVAAAGADEVVAYLRERAITIVAARVEAATDYDAVDLTGSVAIVVGAEVEGLSAAWAGADVRPVRIPMAGIADSLNVAASAAVLFFEARRQRRVRARISEEGAR